MRMSFIVPLAIAASLVLYGQQAMPRMTAVEPVNGKVGDVITVTGENLEKTQVDKVYLTDGKNDVAVELMEQSAKALKFKIPDKASPGRFALMLLTAGKEPKLIEQPVKLTIQQ